MPTLYMIFWSFVMIAALGIWRLRNLRQIIVVVIVTLVVLLFSQTLFVQLAVNAGMDPSIAAVNPFLFLAAGPLGLLALLVMLTLEVAPAPAAVMVMLVPSLPRV